MAKALRQEFRKSLRSLRNPFGDGHAADRIVKALTTVPLGDRLLRKRFYDLPSRRRSTKP